MTRRTEIRVREVHRRVREKRRRRERRIRSGLTGTSLCLLAGIVWLLKGVQTPGVNTPVPQNWVRNYNLEKFKSPRAVEALLRKDGLLKEHEHE